MKETDSHYKKTYPVSWSQLHNDCRALAWRLLELRTNWERIIAIARGGLVPAAIIARELDIHYIDTVCVSSYTVRAQGGFRVIKNVAGDSERTLIIDDLVEHGKNRQDRQGHAPTEPFRHGLRQARRETLTDTYITEVSQETWIPSPGGLRTPVPVHRPHSGPFKERPQGVNRSAPPANRAPQEPWGSQEDSLPFTDMASRTRTVKM